PELDFRLDSAWGRLALGRLLPGTGAAPESLAALCAAPPLETNAARLVAGRTTFVEVGIAAGGVLRACLSSLVADAPAGPAIPQQDLELFLRRASEQSLKAGCLDVGRLCGLFGLSPEEVGLVASAAARARAADPAAELSIAAALRRDCSALLARNASLVPSPWWERGPPARGSGAEWRRPLAGGEPSGAPASPSSRDAGPPARRPQAAGGPLGALGAATGPASALPAAGDSGRSTGDDAGGLAELMAALGEGEGAEEKRTTAESLAVPAPDGPPPPTGPAGEAEKKQPLGGQTELERLLAYLERRESSDTDPPTCALCFEPVAKGSVNSAHLGCGHVLHWAAAGGCGGLVTWSRLNDTCPLCRARFEHAGQDREARPRAVQVSWARPGERG
ncbi:MAG TPA: hypothetical protein VNI01_12795, partial [Elusimicrobiota bacterium]|nr:hypothetical protein [Elusimicrobiota bacterium]